MTLEPHLILGGENPDGSAWVLTLRDVPAAPSWLRLPIPRATPIDIGVWTDTVRGAQETTCN